MRDSQVSSFLEGHSGFSRGLISVEKPNDQVLLSSVLESSTDDKFNLSPRACNGILERAAKRGKELPPLLQKALDATARKYEMYGQGVSEDDYEEDFDALDSEVSSEASQGNFFDDNSSLSKSKEASVKEERVLCFEPRSPDGHARVVGDICPTLNTMGGGQREPCVAVPSIKVLPLNTMTVFGRPSDDGRMGSGIGGEIDPCPTLTKAHSHAVAIQGSMIGREHNNGPQGDGVNDEISFTLNTIDRHAVAYGIPGNWVGRKPENGGNATTPMKDLAPNLTSTDRHAVAYGVGEGQESSPRLLPGDSNSDQNGSATCIVEQEDLTVVRRLTPKECERLQGFGDDYTNIPTASDGPRYKALGNSMAVPVMRWVGERVVVSKMESGYKRSEDFLYESNEKDEVVGSLCARTCQSVSVQDASQGHLIPIKKTA